MVKNSDALGERSAASVRLTQCAASGCLRAST